MSLSTSSSTGSPYAAMNTSSSNDSGVLNAIEALPGAIASGVEDVGEKVSDVASATVSFSERALQALASGGMALVHGIENVIAFPFEVAADVATGAENAIEGGAHLVARGVSATVDGVETLASDVTDVAQAVLGSAGTVAAATVGVSVLTGDSPAKVISSVL